MANLRHNVLASVLGKMWNVLLSLAVVPVYLRVLGVEAYGLIGIFVTLTGIVVLFDLGLGTALSRELARYSARDDSAREMRNLLRSVETIYWLMGFLIGVVLVATAPFLAEHWIKPQALPRETVERTLVLIGIAVACMWPRALYANGLTGLQRQVALNVLSSAMGTLQNVGGVIVVWQAQTIEALIAWYACVGLLDSVMTGILLWRTIPASGARAVFDAGLLAQIGRFATGMATISVLSVLLTQLDKIILSNVLTLEAFAYYTLAWRVAGGLYYLTTPITSTFFPRFSQLAVQRDQVELTRLYHRSCQLLSV
ncbi:MAG: lipopolysaccharide biosynthesis protein, partial [Burkholderiales bacterium]